MKKSLLITVIAIFLVLGCYSTVTPTPYPTSPPGSSIAPWSPWDDEADEAWDEILAETGEAMMREDMEGTEQASEAEFERKCCADEECCRDLPYFPCCSTYAGRSGTVVISQCPQGRKIHVPGCDIKGNISFDTGEKIYHVKGQEFYEDTVISPTYGERWFCTEEEAKANGWRKALN